MHSLKQAPALLFALMVGWTLTAQTLVTAGDNNLSLAQVLRFHPEGMILSLPGAQGQSLGPAIEAALDQEPAVALQLSSQELILNQKVGAELQRLKGWSAEKPHWVMIGPDQRVHAEGSEAPTPALIFEAYGQSPLRTRASVLREFLKLNSDQSDALARLILATRSLAERRTELLLRPKPTTSVQELPPTRDRAAAPKEALTGSTPGETVGEPVPDSAPAATALPARLRDEQDANVWDDYAALYERFIREGHWLDLAPDGSGPISMAGQLSDSAEHSPHLIALAQKLLPTVEDHLRSRPSDEGRWQVWASLRSALGEVRPSTVLQGLRPLPGAHRWPPAAALSAFVEEAQRTGDWHQAEPVLQTSFDQNSEFLHALEAAAQEDASQRWNTAHGETNSTAGPKVEMGNYFGFGGWNGEIALLVEAKLRLGKLAEADRIVQEVYARVPKNATAESAAALARTCGATGLAEKWGRLAK